MRCGRRRTASHGRCSECRSVAAAILLYLLCPYRPRAGEAALKCPWADGPIIFRGSVPLARPFCASKACLSARLGTLSAVRPNSPDAEFCRPEETERHYYRGCRASVAQLGKAPPRWLTGRDSASADHSGQTSPYVSDAMKEGYSSTADLSRHAKPWLDDDENDKVSDGRRKDAAASNHNRPCQHGS